MLKFQRIVAGAGGALLSLVILQLAQDCKPESARLIRVIAGLWLIAELYFLVMNV